MRAIGLLVTGTVLVACGQRTPGPPPSPLTVVLDDEIELTINPDPLELRLVREGEVLLAQQAFVEIGIKRPDSEASWVDPASPPSEIGWIIAARALSLDAATGTFALALPGGVGEATLTVSEAGLSIDASKVTRAVLARFVLPLADAEEIYGLGELFDSPASRGVVREMQLRIDPNSASSTNETHVPVPLAIYPGRGLAFLAEEDRPGAFDVGVAREDAMLVTFATQRLALRILVGAPLELLRRYAAATRPPALPPEWAFAPMQWRNDHRDEAEVLADARALRDLSIPGSAVWIDNPWQTGYNTFAFETERFPDPAGLVAELSGLGFATVLWSTPYVGKAPPTDADHAEAAALDYLITDDLDRPFDWPWQNGPGALVDFTAPGATDWWQGRIQRATALGVKGWKLDFAEDLVPELFGNATPFRLHGGGTDTFHARYAERYHEAYLGTLNRGDGFLITRAGTWGSQGATTCVWPGDLDNDFSRHEGGHVGGLPAAIAAGLSLSASGFPFFGSDIGGFRGGPPTAEVLVRWAEYAALGTIMQLGGGGGRGTSHNPWDTALYGPESLPIYRTYARLHMDLFPTLYTLARRAAETGEPVLRAPGLMYPGQPYEDAFLVGDAIFVAPVVEAGATSRRVHLPPGDWVDWWSGERSTGDMMIEAPAPLERLPLWRKVGEIVVLLDTSVDTLLPATVPGVTSFAVAANQRAIRVLVTPAGDSAFDLYDGSRVSTSDAGGSVHVGAVAGSRHRDFTFDLDWTNSALGETPPTKGSLPRVEDGAALAGCTTSCWTYDAEAGRARVRLVDVGMGAGAQLAP